MITFVVGDVFFDIDLSFLLEKTKAILTEQLIKRISFIEETKSSKRVKIIFKDIFSTFSFENLEREYQTNKNYLPKIGSNLTELLIKNTNGYYLKYLIDTSKMELTVFFEEKILNQPLLNENFDFFSLTLGGFDYVLLNIFLVKYNHLMLHSSAFIYENAAFLFLGHSGYGKSTIYNLVSNKIEKIIPLGEDRNILYLKDDIVYLSNFWKEFVSIKNNVSINDDIRFHNYTAELKKAFFIEKAETNTKIHIDSKMASLKMFNTFFRLSTDKVFIDEATALIFKFTTIFNNFYILKFKKDNNFITFIKKELKNEI